MKKIIFLVTWIIIVLVLGFQNRVVLAESIEKIIYHSPCDTPIPYRIGTVDSRFNITREEFLSSIEDAKDIWSLSYGKTLFEHDPKGQLSVNLVYDERQLLNNQITELDNEITQKKDTIAPKIEEYKRKSIDFDKKVTQLNQEIDYWNSHGGADPTEYKKLKDEQESLRKEAEELNELAALLNQSTIQYNSKLRELNKTVEEFNEELKYKPEEGIYISDENGRRIIIYFNTSKDELVHTLAHEMGHALGISHINSTSSIMYPRTTDVSTLSDDDLAALSFVCRKISILEVIKNKADYAITIIKSQGVKGLLDDIRRSNFTNPM